MAINYLNTVNLNKNQLEQAAIQNLTADPATGVLGQVYYNTVVSELKICTTANVVGPPAENAVWTVVGSYDYWVLDANGNGATANITNGMTADFVGGLKITTDSAADGTLNIVHDLQAQTDSANTAAPGYGGTFTTVDTVTRDTTGHVTGINVKTITLPTVAYTLDKAAASSNLVLKKDGAAQDTIVFAGTPDQIEIDVAVEDSYTFQFPAAGVILPNGSTATTQATGDNSTKVATTAFVQASVTGLLEFKGGFDADTGTIVGGTTNLTKNNQPNAGDLTVAVAVGDYYVVTADGDFFGNTATPLTVGDSVIVQTAAAAGASVEADFIVVQSDTDLATATTVGLGNVVPGTSATVTAPYVAGTATIDVVDSTASQKGAVIVAGGAGISVAYASGTATVTANSNGARQDLLSSDANVTRTESGGLTTFALDVGAILGSTSALNVKAEIISAAGQTVYADITRSGTTLNVIFTGSVADSAYQALLIDLA
jgi:hypothetical protein